MPRCLDSALLSSQQQQRVHNVPLRHAQEARGALATPRVVNVPDGGAGTISGTVFTSVWAHCPHVGLGSSSAIARDGGRKLEPGRLPGRSGSRRRVAYPADARLLQVGSFAAAAWSCGFFSGATVDIEASAFLTSVSTLPAAV